ncbi:MAG: Gfo/Idh/MocA family oxidoreductase [bacterium]
MINFGMVGIGGYAGSYLNSLEKLEDQGFGRLAAIVIRNQRKYERIIELWHIKERGIKIYPSLDEMLDNEKNKMQIVALPVGIPDHRPMSIQCMEAGFDVVCEKPPAPTIQDIDAMIRVSNQTRRFCLIGFQSQFASATRRIKAHILEGHIGEIKEIACKAAWRRLDKYYERNPWAGKFKAGDKLILDGPLNNPHAHYVNNCLYFAGRNQNETGRLAKIRAELYKGHDIEGEDTACFHAQTVDGTNIYLYSTLCFPEKPDIDPYIEITGTKGSISGRINSLMHSHKNQKIIETFRYDDDGRVDIFKNACELSLGKTEEQYCSAQSCRNYLLAINGAYESAQKVIPIPDQYLTRMPEEDSTATYIKGIGENLITAFDSRKMFSELDLPWAKTQSRYFTLDNYKAFTVSSIN